MLEVGYCCFLEYPGLTYRGDFSEDSNSGGRDVPCPISLGKQQQQRASVDSLPPIIRHPPPLHYNRSIINTVIFVTGYPRNEQIEKP